MTTNPTPESTVLKHCLLAATKAGARVWRNNVGLLYAPDGRPLRVGLCPGSADLIGLTASGRFLAVECKRSKGGRVSAEQRRWLDLVASMGGVAIVATCGEDVTMALAEAETQRRDYFRRGLRAGKTFGHVLTETELYEKYGREI
jgi:hypothetical protein